MTDPNEPRRRIYVDAEDSDWFSARDVAHANALRNALYGDLSAEEAADNPFTLLPDDSLLTVHYVDGADAYHGAGAYPSWADDEPEAKVEWFASGKERRAKVTAPARVWAAREEGIIASTEY